MARVSGTKIRQLRETKKLLQHDLASSLRQKGFGTTQATISRWEAGQEPRASVLRALASELGVKVDELYGDDDEESRGVGIDRVLLGQLHLALGVVLGVES